MKYQDIVQKVAEEKETNVEYVVYQAFNDTHENTINFQSLSFIDLMELDRILRDLGVEEFTCTSETSNMLREWHELQTFGWKIDGMRELCVPAQPWDEFETCYIPAFLFKKVK